jgi:hypothetical protein
VRRQACVGNILAPANDRLGTRQFPQFGTQGKSPVESAREAAQFIALPKETLGRLRPSASRETGDLALDQRQFHTSHAGWFASTKNSRH